MLLTAPNGPLSVQPRRTGSARISLSSRLPRPSRSLAPAILFFTCATFGASISRAQDQQDQSVAEAARQERARKQELQKRAKHVYTEEDLKHPNILTPEDRAQVEAKRAEVEAKKNECVQKNNCAPAPLQNPPASLDANSQQLSLGEIARQLRKQKELQALKPKQSEPFHLPFPTPALASPILRERPAVHPPAQPVLRSPAQPLLRPLPQPARRLKTPSNVFRRDPFSAVPVPQVRRPELRNPEAAKPDVRRDVRPSVRENIRPTVRAQPPALAQPAQPVAPIVPAETLRPVQPRPSATPTIVTKQGNVTVRSGDSLWKLAQDTLGRGSRWPELVAANPWIANPNQIRAGAQLRLPATAAVPVSRRTDTSGVVSTLTIRIGDTLWSVARAHFGHGALWSCIARANPGVANANLIFEGEQLVLPGKCTP
jgi:nucleoid-associated protein YgaU